MWFLIESLIALQQRWRDAGSRLLVVEGDPVQLLPQLAEQIAAEAVVWNRDVEPYARERDRQVAQRLQADGRKVVVDWDQLLIAPELLKTGEGDPYRVYGPFLRNWRGQVQAKQTSTVAAPTGLVDLPPEQVPATGVVDYKYKMVQNPMSEDAWVKAVEIIPGDRAVLNHVITTFGELETDVRRAGLLKRGNGG